MSSVVPTGPATWTTGHFTVRFVAGERSVEKIQPPSRYEVIPTRLGEAGRLIIASEHSTGGFASATNPEPENHIAVFQDAEAEAVLIQETIPNDCGPCTNYLWIRPAGPTAFTNSYLQLPERSRGDHQGIDSEFPDVLSLRDGVLSYRYSSGPKVTVKVDSVPTSPAPTPPG